MAGLLRILPFCSRAWRTVLYFDMRIPCCIFANRIVEQLDRNEDYTFRIMVC